MPSDPRGELVALRAQMAALMARVDAVLSGLAPMTKAGEPKRRTPERLKALLVMLGPDAEHMSYGQMAKALAPLPGREISGAEVKRWVSQARLRDKAIAQAAEGGEIAVSDAMLPSRGPERRALFETLWKQEFPLLTCAEIRARLNAETPGREITLYSLYEWRRDLGLPPRGQIANRKPRPAVQRSARTPARKEALIRLSDSSTPELPQKEILALINAIQDPPAPDLTLAAMQTWRRELKLPHLSTSVSRQPAAQPVPAAPRPLPAARSSVFVGALDQNSAQALAPVSEAEVTTVAGLLEYAQSNDINARGTVREIRDRVNAFRVDNGLPPFGVKARSPLDNGRMPPLMVRQGTGEAYALARR